MENNDFETDTKRMPKKDFLHSITGLMVAAIILTGILSIGGVFYIFRGIYYSLWEDIGVYVFVRKSAEFVTIMLLFVSLVKISVDEKPFSSTIPNCICAIGFLFSACSVVLPRLGGYQSSGIDIYAFNGYTLIDGTILLIGVLFIILGKILKAGFTIQKEFDEIL